MTTNLETSRYLEREIKLYFDENKAKQFVPIVYDPNNFGTDPEPDGIFYRILKKGNEEAIQYFVHYRKQDCTWQYPGIGYLFSHDFDYEPIIVFLENEKPSKLVLSAAGSLIQGGHQTEIYRKDESMALGKVTYKTNKQPEYPYGINETTGHFKEDTLDKIVLKEKRPLLGLATCYHVYTPVKKYLQGQMLDLELFPLTDEILTEWYEQENFGHDVSNPWKYPGIRYYPSPKMKLLTEERTELIKISIEDAHIKKGLAFLDRLRSESNHHKFLETLHPQIDHEIWPQSQYMMHVLFTILGMADLAKKVKENNDFYEHPRDRDKDEDAKALDRFCILINDTDNFALQRLTRQANASYPDCIALMGLYLIITERKDFIGKIIRFFLSLFRIKSESEKYFTKLEEMYDPKLGFFQGGELYKLSLFGIFAKKLEKTEWINIITKRLKETQSENGGWKTHWVGPTEPRPIGTVENLESTALSIIALYL